MDVLVEKMCLKDLDEISKNLSTDFDDFWSYSIFESELKQDNSHYLVAKVNKKIVGFAGIKLMVDSADLMNIVTKKQFRNQGIASILLEHIIKLVKKLNVNSIFLEVNSKNVYAIKLYEKYGFYIISRRKDYYINNDAIIMKKDL